MMQIIDDCELEMKKEINSVNHDFHEKKKRVIDIIVRMMSDQIYEESFEGLGRDYGRSMST